MKGRGVAGGGSRGGDGGPKGGGDDSGNRGGQVGGRTVVGTVVGIFGSSPGRPFGCQRVDDVVKIAGRIRGLRMISVLCSLSSSGFVSRVSEKHCHCGS